MSHWCDDFILWSESHTSYELCSLSKKYYIVIPIFLQGSMGIFCILLYNILYKFLGGNDNVKRGKN